MRRLGKSLLAWTLVAAYAGWFIIGPTDWDPSAAPVPPAAGEGLAVAVATPGPAVTELAPEAARDPSPADTPEEPRPGSARRPGRAAASAAPESGAVADAADGPAPPLLGLGAGGAIGASVGPIPAAEAESVEIEESLDPAPPVDDSRLLVWNLSGRRTLGYPHMRGEIVPELEYNAYFAATDPERQRDNWLANIHLQQTLELTSRLELASRFRVVLESNGEDDRFYADYPYAGVYLIEALLRYRGDHFSVFAGKYEPAGHERGHAPIFFGNYTRNLDLDRRLGAGASVSLPSERLGTHTLTGHVFRVDTTRLRGELFSDRWRDDAFLDGAGDVGFWPPSYLVTLGGGTTNLGYTVGAGVQRRGELPEEHVYLAAVTGAVPLGSNGLLELSVDFLQLDNAGGYAEDKKVIEPGIGWSAPSFFIGAAHSVRHVEFLEDMEAVGRFDHITEIVGRYYLSQRSTVEAAYQHVYEGGQNENAFGVAIRYWIDWLIH